MKFMAMAHRAKLARRKALGKIIRRLLRHTGYELGTMEQRIEQQTGRQVQEIKTKLQQLEQSLLSEKRQREGLSLRLADSIRHLTSLTCKAEIASTALLVKISVILPVYNRADMVSAAIESLLDQHDVTLELLVVDDGSSDDLDAAIGPYLSHPAVRYLQLKHAGTAAAKNYGLATSTGDIIVYIDSDNTMYPGYLRSVAISYADRPDAECGFAAMLWDDGQSGVHLRHDTFDWQHLLAGDINLDLNCFSHRRTLWTKLGGFDESLTRHADYDLVLRYTKVHEPLRIRAVAVHYNNSFLYPRISNTQPSQSNITRIRSKHSNVR